jgi:hypothetical protein
VMTGATLHPQQDAVDLASVTNGLGRLHAEVGIQRQAQRG